MFSVRDARREHAAQRREVAARAKLHPLHEQVGFAVLDAGVRRVQERCSPAARSAGKAIGFGGERVGHRRVVDLQKAFGDAIAAVDAAAAHRLPIAELHPEFTRS